MRAERRGQRSDRPSATLARDLGRLAGGRVSVRTIDREAYARDAWPRGLIALAGGAPPASVPDAVVWPEGDQEVAAILRFASRRRIPVVPYGAGSGVCGAAVPVARGIVMDLKRMTRLLSLRAEDHAAAFQAGIMGQVLEDRLARRGFTLGHFPSSMYCSTLGGWLAARSAGQFSSRYGKIEDMVRGLRAVSGAGERLEADFEHSPALGALILGSEGTLAVITDARLRIHPAPDKRVLRGYRFGDVDAGCEGMRAVMQLGLRPAMLRLYDPIDTLLSSSGSDEDGRLARLAAYVNPTIRDRARSFAVRHASQIGRALHVALARARGCLLIAGFEGTQERAAAEAALGHQALTAAGGSDLGPEPGERWLAHRYRVSYQQSKVFMAGAFVDTMEVATTWDRLPGLYRAVRSAISRRALVLAHFSHAYPEGCSIYFTFVASLQDGERRYDGIWRAAVEAALRADGCLSHHHGIGLSKVPWLNREHGEAMQMLRAAKRALDPAGILNPGKMLS